MHRLGYACINMSLNNSTKRVLTSRTCRISTFALENVSSLILENAKDLLTILKWNVEHKIYFYRISSDIFPFMDHPTMGYEIESLKDSDLIKGILLECGNYAKDNNIRLSTHPGPYNCLGSPNPDVIHKTILSLEMHRKLGELLSVDDFVINIHVGGSYGGEFEQTATRFIHNFSSLTDKCRNWLTIENDDRASLWTVTKLYNYIYKHTNIPIVYDVHHWLFCQEETMLEAFNTSISTWGVKTPKVHYSESSDTKRLQAHSDYVVNAFPLPLNIDYDIMIEAKQKELALLKYRELFNF